MDRINSELNIESRNQKSLKKNIKWGILGLGKIAHKFASDLSLSQNSNLYAVASRSREKALNFAGKFGAEAPYDAYALLINDPEVDIVYIATPHAFHFKWAKKCLENGKHVLCEKPLGMNESEVKGLIEIARKNKLFLMEGLWTRFIPSFEKMLDLIAGNTIGDIEMIKADFGFRAEKDLSGRLFNKNLGGGALLDIGIYPIYLSLILLGWPKNIKSSARITSEGIDSYSAVIFEYENSSMANLEATFEMDTPIEACIYGTKGELKMHRRFHHSKKISLKLNNGERQDYEIEYKGEGYSHEIEEVEKCINSGALESKKHPLSRSLELIRILDKIKVQIGLTYAADQ